jgi:hypothetical protein
MFRDYSFTVVLPDSPDVVVDRLADNTQPHTMFVGQTKTFVGSVTLAKFSIFSYLPIPYGLPQMVGTFEAVKGGTTITVAFAKSWQLLLVLPGGLVVCLPMLRICGFSWTSSALISVLIEVGIVILNFAIIRIRAPLAKESSCKQLTQGDALG